MTALQLKLDLIEKQINSYLSQYFNLTNEIVDMSKHKESEIEINYLKDRSNIIKERLSKFKMKHTGVLNV